MSWFEHDESRIYYEQDGQGEPVLVLPGWGGGIGEFEPIRQSLAPHFRVIAADLPARVSPNRSPASTRPLISAMTPRASWPCSTTRPRRRHT